MARRARFNTPWTTTDGERYGIGDIVSISSLPAFELSSLISSGRVTIIDGSVEMIDRLERGTRRNDRQR